VSYVEPQLLKVYDPVVGATNVQNSSGAEPVLVPTLFELPVVAPVMVFPQVAVPSDCGAVDGFAQMVKPP
jgi:hypothetical protein